jgi:undecaprenyl-diphosphatase
VIQASTFARTGLLLHPPSAMRTATPVPFVHILVLAAVQGLTEFLPVSSSGHLLLVPYVMGWSDQGRIIDVAMHIGTLLAVLIYFWRDVFAMTRAFGRSFGLAATGRPMDKEFWLIWKLIVASIPAIAAGLAIEHYFPDGMRNIAIVAWTTIVFGILLYAADKMFMTIRRMEHISFAGAFFVGCFQAMALIPGTSRSGATMTAARILGVERSEAARFSFLMAIPTILGAGLLEGYKVYQSGDMSLAQDAVTGGALAFVFGLAAIAFMMAWLRRASFTPFVVYRLFLGAILMWVVYGA